MRIFFFFLFLSTRKLRTTFKNENTKNKLTEQDERKKELHLEKVQIGLKYLQKLGKNENFRTGFLRLSPFTIEKELS